MVGRNAHTVYKGTVTSIYKRIYLSTYSATGYAIQGNATMYESGYQTSRSAPLITGLYLAIYEVPLYATADRNRLMQNFFTYSTSIAGQWYANYQMTYTCDFSTVTTGTTYLTRSSTYATEYLTRSSTSGYSGVSSSSSESSGWE